MHSRYLETVLASPSIKNLVLERQGRVAGFATIRRQASFYFVDDVCFIEDIDWNTEVIQLFRAIEERPAIATLAHGDTALINGAILSGLKLISTHRLFKLGKYESALVGRAVETPNDRPDPPMHVFSEFMDEQSSIIVTDDIGGYAVCSRSIDPPPILDIGGTSAVIDRVIGDDRQSTLESCLTFVQRRGDIGAIVIVDAQDRELDHIVASMGATHPVDVLEWPAPDAQAN